MKYCPNCNQVAEDNMVFCIECGTRLPEKLKDTGNKEQCKQSKSAIEKNRNKQWVWILLTFVFCAWAIVMTVLYIDANDSKEYYYDEYREWRAEARDLQDQVAFMDKYVVLVFDDSLDYYHTYECYEKFDGSFWAYNINAAENKGYTPCPDCH